MEALYNKYRPQIFEDVVGQEHIERTIKNAIASNKISHAYMFTGPRGTGKTTTARLLSKALLCKEGPTPDPDGTCEDCELIAAGEHPDVYELDAASRTGVENVREEIIGKVDYAPTRGKYKVYIIDEVHMLSTAAFNALLKTLEEPPDHVIFIMCTTDPQKIPETILSRCQRFDFRRISSEELVTRLGAICEMEDIKFDGDALDLIAHRAQGGMRDALTSLEQLIAFGNGDVSMEVAERLLGSLDSSDLAEIVKAIGTRNVAECFNWTSSYMETGADLVQFVDDLTQHIRNMYVMSLAGADVALEVTEAGRRELEVELSWYGPERLARMLEVLGDLTKELKTSTNQRLSFEIALTRMVRPESDMTLSALYERIERLEAAIKSGTKVQNQPVALEAQVASDAASGVEVEKPAVSDISQQNSPSDEGVIAEVAIEEPNEKFAKPEGSEAINASMGQRSSIDARQLWNSVLAHLKKIGPAYSVVFMNTNPTINDGVFVIEFSQNNDFAFKAAQKQDAREALEKAFERAGHPGITYQISQSSNTAANTAKVSHPVKDSTNEESVVEKASNSVESVAIEDDVAEKEVAAASSAGKPIDDPKPTSSDENVVGERGQQVADEVFPASQGDVPPWEDDSDLQPMEAASNESVEKKAGDEDVRESSDVAVEPQDSSFQDLLTSAFGEGIVVEEIKE